MSCVEKRHLSHRMGSMLHHRFPNGFTDLFMDETDREVSTLTDRAFRSLCVGDDAVYNDDFLYGYSPFNCHKPVVGEPHKKTHQKESKKQGQCKGDKNDAQPWKQQQKNMSHMSSFLKALSATEESCEGLLIKNDGMTDSNGESWDKSALRSIQRELSEFSPDYHANLTDGRYKNNQRHNSGDGKSNKVGKDGAPPSGKSKIKNGKSTVKLRKLNIKNFFLHSEFSPFQTWRDSNRFSFGQEDHSILPVDNTPKWYDLPFYKELTETHRKEPLHSEETQPCQEAATEPPPPADSKPIPPPSPPKVLPKPTAPQAQKRCSSEGGEGSTAPWRRNRSRAKSAVPGNQPRIPAQENYSTTVEETALLLKNEARSVEVKAVEEVSSLASTPFSICQLMTPLIPSRQPTETSEILQGVLSPSALDLPLRPHSEAKLTPEPPVKRDSYKSLASSILFNLKDNRKRVKSRYSPPKFKTFELPESSTQSPLSDSLKLHRAPSEGIPSGFSTPAIFKDGLTVTSPVLESTGTPIVGLTKPDADRPLSDDYLLSNLLQSKKDSNNSEENPVPLLIQSKKNKSPIAKKQNYPSLNLYKRTSPVEGEIKYLQVPVCTSAHEKIEETAETNELSPLTLNKAHSPKAPPTHTGPSQNVLKPNKDRSPLISPRAVDSEGSSASVPAEKRSPNVPDKPKKPAKEIQENDFAAQSSSSKEKEAGNQHISTIDVIRAAKEAINAAKKGLLVGQSESTEKPIRDKTEQRENEIDVVSEEISSSQKESSVAVNDVSSVSRNESSGTTLKDKNAALKKEPPPVPKRTFAKSDIQLTLDKQPAHNTDKLPNGNLGELDLPTKDSVHNERKLKHIFSARQNNYIKYQRYAGTDNERGDENGDQKVNARAEKDDEMVSPREARDSESIISDLHALKELERARLGEHIHENRKSHSGGISIDEEARAKNDLISRELRNMKKGMLSMRGNAKRDIFAKKEELSKQDTYAKIDTNVIVNKALINDNYDKAKMALEEIISERQIRRNMNAEQDAKLATADLNGDDRYVARTQQSKKPLKDPVTEADAYAIKEADLRERLGDLRDHNHMRNILSQTEPKLGETHRSGVRVALPGMDKVDNELKALLKTKGKRANDETIGYSNYVSNNSEVVHLSSKAKQGSEDSTDNFIQGNESKKLDAPSVPPRSKKGAGRSDGSATNEINELKNVAEEDIFNKDGLCLNGDAHLVKEMSRTGLRTEKVTKEAVNSESSFNSKMTDVVTNSNFESNSVDDTVPYDHVLPSKQSKYENEMTSVAKSRGSENTADNLHKDITETREGGSIGTCPSGDVKAPLTAKVKRKAPPRPDQLQIPDDNETKNQAPEEYPNRAPIPDANVDADDLSESSRHVLSPLLLVNGVSVTQSPPDQASLSSKSSYFSVESALHRNTESESNVYQSLENLIAEVEGVDDGVEDIQRNSKQDTDRPEMEYYSFSDHESEPELGKKPVKSPQKEKEVLSKEKPIGETTTTGQSSSNELTDQTPMSPSNTFSPTLGIPALFKIKDNTFSKKAQPQKILQPWSPRSNLSSSEKGEEVSPQIKEHSVISPANETYSFGSTSTAKEIFIPKEILPEPTPPLLSPPNLPRDTPKKPQVGGLLTVPQEEDRYSGISPSSEGVESLTTSTTDTAEEMGMTAEVSTDLTVGKVPSEHSGSTCSANDGLTGFPKPPAVLPKSEKAVLKAIKLTNRRIKKEEAEKSPHRSSANSSRHKSERHRSDKSEPRGSRSHRSGDRKHRDKEGDQRGSNSHERSGTDGANPEGDDAPRDRPDVSRKPRGSRDSVDRADKEAPLGASAERKGRGGSRHAREKPEHRHYSSDRVISNVPVYKAHVGDRPMSDRPFNRSQSIDRYLGDKVERRLSTDSSANEKLDPRSQRIEKSIMDELQQRGRARDKTSRENTPRRSHSIDAYSSDAPLPSTLPHQLSRQSSHNSQLSRQSSIEHTIVTQSFPMTQRKLLQDPDSGQYFFVDMPVQVKTKTFFDPETGSYVQLPVQPPEGTVLQPSPMEVLTPPLVVYHGFVPVPLSPMAQNATLPAPHREPEELRHLERSRQMHCKQGQPYLEPVYGQHDHVLGEFLGTEELDCSS